MSAAGTITPDPADSAETPAEHIDPVARARPLNPIGSAAMLTPIYLFLAAGWLRAGVEKVIDPTWWTGHHLVEFLDDQRSSMLPMFTPFADFVIEPLAPFVSWIVVTVQLAIAICLVTNRHLRPALWAGVVLNVCFTMAGRVNPSAFYLVMQMTLLFALARPVGLATAVRRAVVWLVPAALFAPFVRTIEPAHLIDDPASMLSFVSLLSAATTVAATNQRDELSRRWADNHPRTRSLQNRRPAGNSPATGHHAPTPNMGSTPTETHSRPEWHPT